MMERWDPFHVRLARRIWLMPDGCWEWRGSLCRGYGRIRCNGKLFASHRAVYELLVGPIPEGLELDHLCRNRACCNPSHLEPVSRRENVLRGVSPTALNAVKTHCPRGHAYNTANTKIRDGKGGRDCILCNRIRAAEHKRRKRLARAAA